MHRRIDTRTILQRLISKAFTPVLSNTSTAVHLINNDRNERHASGFMYVHTSYDKE